MNWLNLKFDKNNIRRQSEYFNLYETHLKILRDLDLVYPCWATRSEIKKTINIIENVIFPEKYTPVIFS